MQLLPTCIGRSLDDRFARRNPALQAIAVRDLAPRERDSLKVRLGENVWCVLRGRETMDLTVGLDYESTLLFYSLLKPKTVMAALPELNGPNRYRTIAKLVYDEVLQLEQPDGSFAHGLSAHKNLVGDRGGIEAVGDSRQLDRLSASAIDYALATRSHSTAALARRLYSFNATPLNNRWIELLEKPNAVSQWLGIFPTSSWSRQLAERYETNALAPSSSPWVQWTRRGLDPRQAVRYKIYISPASNQLPQALPIVAEVCRLMDVPAFKVGATAFGALRPDKMVVYLAGECALWDVAGELRSSLAHIEPQGVPFTTPIDGDGLLSWAIDPDIETMLMADDESCSWRTVIAGRLAESISRARGLDCDAGIVEFALQRLRLEGIEPIGWRGVCGDPL